MKKFEKTIITLAVIGIVMKFLLLPGGTLLTIISLSLIMFFYYFFGIGILNELPFKQIFDRNTYKDYSLKRIFGSIGAGITLGAITAGILFKLMFFPGDQINLLTGITAGFFVAIVSSIKYAKTKDKLYQNTLQRIIIVGGIGLILFITPRISLIKIQFKNHPRYIEAYQHYLEDPANEQNRSRLEIEYIRATTPQQFHIDESK